MGKNSSAGMATVGPHNQLAEAIWRAYSTKKLKPELIAQGFAAPKFSPAYHAAIDVVSKLINTYNEQPLETDGGPQTQPPKERTKRGGLMFTTYPIDGSRIDEVVPNPLRDGG